MSNPIFILGSARSGTSLLSRIIDSHPNIGVPFESQLYNTFYPWLKYYGDLSDIKNQCLLLKDILLTDPMQGWDPKPDLDETLNNVTRTTFDGLVEALIGAWAKKRNKKRWGEKTPWHVYYWREILNGFPDAKFIHIVRDGRDASMSWKAARFGPKHIYPLAKKWRNYLDVVTEFEKEVSPSALYELRYEDLLDNPEGIAREICTFVGEEYSEEMLNFYKNPALYPTDKGNEKNLTKPLMNSNKDKWKLLLNKGDREIFESVAGHYLDKYSYEREFENPKVSGVYKKFVSYCLHPLLRIKSMIKNKKGHRDGLIRIFIYLRLRLRNIL